MRASISRPLLYKSSALPTELIRRFLQSGIEPESSVWKTDILPLNYWRCGRSRIRTDIGEPKVSAVITDYTIQP
jgi:hypothetical protein